MMRNLTVNGERLWASLMELARIGATEKGGVCRLAASNLDTQPTGGRFDGAYGVMAGLELVRSLNDLGYETEAPVEIVAWTNEEGSRFSPAMVGSGAFTGVFALEAALATPDNT